MGMPGKKKKVSEKGYGKLIKYILQGHVMIEKDQSVITAFSDTKGTLHDNKKQIGNAIHQGNCSQIAIWLKHSGNYLKK